MTNKQRRILEDAEISSELMHEVDHYLKDVGAVLSGTIHEKENYLTMLCNDIAEFVDFFEVGRKTDIETYHKYVFKDIEEKPIIICSDCHDPRDYTVKESLWAVTTPPADEPSGPKLLR